MMHMRSYWSVRKKLMPWVDQVNRRKSLAPLRFWHLMRRHSLLASTCTSTEVVMLCVLVDQLSLGIELTDNRPNYCIISVDY
jgi:hypothetical protein